MHLHLSAAKVLLIFLLPASLVACAAGEVTTTSTLETLAPTTTVEKDSQIELESLASKSNAIDFSRISKSKCGDFSLVVQETRISFYEWKNNSWIDRSELLGNDSDMDPFLVTTRDYTGDGIFEFLVSYNENGESGGYEFGAIFMQVSCNWKWAKLRGYDEITEVMDYLAYEKSTNSLVALDYGPGGRANVVLTFNSQLNEFEAMTLSADDVDVNSIPSPKQKPAKVLLRIECDLKATGMSSSWNGTYYFWRYYNIWSDRSRTVNKVGAGYNPPLDCY